MNNQILLTSLSVDELQSLIDSSIKNALTGLQPAATDTGDDTLIKIQEVCKILNVSKVTVHAWKKTGRLPFYRISNKIYFKRSEVIEALRKVERKSW